MCIALVSSHGILFPLCSFLHCSPVVRSSQVLRLCRISYLIKELSKKAFYYIVDVIEENFKKTTYQKSKAVGPISRYQNQND